MRTILVISVFLILSVIGNIYQYGDRKELNVVIDKAVDANDKWENQLKLKQEEVDGMAFQCQIVGEELERQSKENAQLKEEADNAKQTLRKKDIIGNFDRWIEDNPTDFRNRATIESNRVLSNIVEISKGNRSTNSSSSAKKDTLPVTDNTKNAGT